MTDDIVQILLPLGGLAETPSPTRNIVWHARR